MLPLVVFLLCLLLCQGAGFIGALLTTPEIPVWYAQLTKPAFNPPNWIFAPVWTLLYTAMAWALYLLLQFPHKQRRRNLFLFFLQYLLNIGWTLVFFHWHSLGGGLLVILVLWFILGVSIRQFARCSKKAAWLFVPYFLWVGFAALLNASIWWLNS